MSDIYHYPENFGLHTVAELSWTEPCYDFDLTVVWQDTSTGTLHWASDNGCSCPSPFEDYHDVNDLESGTFADLMSYIESTRWSRYDAEDAEESHNAKIADFYSLIRRNTC